MNIVKILEHKYLGAEWSLHGDTYDGLEWFDESPKPTKAELEALWPEVEYEVAYEAVQAEREAAYSVESDILKFKWEETLDPADHAAFLASKAAIRERHPYPEAPVGKV